MSNQLNTDHVRYVGDFRPLYGKEGRVVKTELIMQAPDFNVPDGNRKFYVVQLDPGCIDPEWPRHWWKFRCTPEELIAI